MANTIASQTLVDGSRNTIVKYTITSDGSGETTLGTLFNASSFVNPTTLNKLMRISYHLNGFSATLFWDATTKVQLMNLSQNHPDDVKYYWNGGLINNGGAGQTGNILITTQGLVGAPVGTTGEIVLYIKHR